MAAEGEIATFIAAIPEPLRWIGYIGIGIGVGGSLARRYLSTLKAVPASETRATIESAAIVDPGLLKDTNATLSDIRTELRSIRMATEAMEKRQEDEVERREAFERYEFGARLKALESVTGRKKED